MPCPHCQSTSTRERAARTQLGYRAFRCQGCKRTFNERSGTPFNHLAFPTDIILMRGFGNFEAAARFCRAFEELRQFERYRRTRAGMGSLAERRQRLVVGTSALQVMLLGA